MKKVESPKDPQITTLESLYKHLQLAIEVEHFTIPPYLCALYSIKDDGRNRVAAELIQSVVMEEMLHMTLASNILLAVGGRPDLHHSNFIPSYPEHMPHSDKKFKVSLEKFSKSAIKTFMKIEKPETNKAKPEAHKYHTIAQFYDAVLEGLEYLCCTLGPDKVFTGKKHHQITNKYYYGGGGRVIPVIDLKSAMHAVEEIKEQGEGHIAGKSIYDGDHKYGQPREVAHYYRFNEILEGQFYAPGDKPKKKPSGETFKVHWNSVYRMRKNPKAGDYDPGSPIREKMDEFNRSYTKLLALLDKSFSGHPSVLLQAVQLMYSLKYKAVALMKIPSGKGNTTVGPSFEFLPEST